MCMHQILLEDNSTPLVEAQRRLKLTMKEVVCREILKWLDAKVIYSILDSSWITVQVVPKKGGMVVIKNENNELISTSTVTS